MSQDLGPSIVSRQLLRSVSQFTQEAGDIGQNALRPCRAAMRRGDPERRLPTMARALGDAGKQQRAASDRLEMLVGLSQAHEDIPPVVDEGNHACGHAW